MPLYGGNAERSHDRQSRPDRFHRSNAAIRASTGDIIVRMDAHTVYARDYIRRCVEVLQESGADNVGGPWTARGEGQIGKAIAAAFQSSFCAGGGKSHNPHFEGEVDTVYLGCWRRSAFDRFGFFDPDLVRNQDDEFNFRIRRQGGRILQSPKIQSTYTPRSSITSLFRQYLQYGYWKVAVIRKHRSLASWRHLVPALFVSSILLGVSCLAAFAAFGKLAVAGSIARLLLWRSRSTYWPASQPPYRLHARSIFLRSQRFQPSSLFTTFPMDSAFCWDYFVP